MIEEGNKNLFFVVDAHSLLHRGYHAPGLSLSGPAGSCPVCKGSGLRGEASCGTCKGTGREPTKATYLFSRTIVHLVRNKRPAYLAICYDGPRDKLLRRKIHLGYKAHRPTSGEDLRVQLRRSRELMELLGVACFQLDGYEADDLIATLTRKCVSDEVYIRVISRDKDLACLVSDPRVKLYDPQEDSELGPEWVLKRFKVKPEQMMDYLTLVGDPGDGVPGVKGIGEKGAASLLQQFGSLEGILGHPQALTPKVREATDPDLNPTLVLSRRLVELDCNVPLKIKPRALECNGLNFKAAANLYRSLGFRRWD